MKAPRKTKRKPPRPGRPKAATFVVPAPDLEAVDLPKSWPRPVAKVTDLPPSPRPEVKVVALPPTGVVQVQVPPGVLPVVAVDPVRKIVEIVPVRRPEPRKKSWWESLFS